MKALDKFHEWIYQHPFLSKDQEVIDRYIFFMFDLLGIGFLSLLIFVLSKYL